MSTPDDILDDLDPSIVGFEFTKEGSDWLAIFNPKVPRQMDVKLTSRLPHEKFASFAARRLSPAFLT